MTCLRAFLLSLAAFSLTLAPAHSQPTCFRHQHTFLLLPGPQRRVVITLAAIRAATGYSDPLVYRLFGTRGEVIAHGSLTPPATKEIAFMPYTAGLYILDANPGMNAFSIQVDGATWCVDLGDRRQLEVIDHANPLYFYVPADLATLKLSFLPNEQATVRLLRPDNSLAVERVIPQFQAATITAPVAGRAGWWHLELSLTQDCGIIFPDAVLPYVAEAPLHDSIVKLLPDGSLMVNFDLQPTPRSQLLNPIAYDAPRYRLATSTGLELGFTPTGQLVRVNIGRRRLMSHNQPQPPLFGFFVRDNATNSPLVPFLASPRSVHPTRNGLAVDYRAPDVKLALRAVYTAAPDHVAVTVRVRNLAAADRAVTVYFALPCPRGKLTWWDDILTPRPVAGNSTLGSFASAPAGANARHSTYPFGCVSGDQALAVAIPMDYPLYHRIGVCTATRQLFLAVDLGLTPATTKFPNRADYSFVIYDCDPQWGLRSAAERYYKIFPRLFTKRMKHDGGWVCWGNCAVLPNIEQLGFKYHWGPADPAAVAFDDTHGLYSFLYNDSMRYFADLGRFDHRPTPQEAVAAMRKLLDAPDPRAHILSVRPTATGRKRYEAREKHMGRQAAEQWLRASIAAVKASAALDANGEIQVGYLVNRADWGGTDWWTGRCQVNVDPDIPGGYGRFLFDHILWPTVAEYRAQGARLDGFGLDNYFSSSTVLDFNRDHLAACDYPPTFAAGDFRPVIIGDTMMYEWTARLKRQLVKRGMWLIANTGVQPFPFAQHLLDINGLEWGLKNYGVAARTLAYHKQVVTLPIGRWGEAFVKAHLPMGAIPGGYATADFKPGSMAARLYEKYVPVILRMNAAGWEPVPWARADNENVSIERFGTRPPLLFSLHNHAKTAVTTLITIDTGALGMTGNVSVQDLLTGQVLPVTAGAGTAGFPVRLAAGDATVVQVR